jgi:hypothetical protein
VNEPALRTLLTVWQRRLGLGEWRLLLKIGGVEDATAYMETHRSALYQRAVIYVQPWIVGLGEMPEGVLVRGGDVTADFIESSLVHELLHLHTRDMRAVVRDDLEERVSSDIYHLAEAAMRRAEEQCVDRLAEALVHAFSEER